MKKDVFERLVDEKKELDEKRSKLLEFIGSKQFSKLDYLNKKLLVEQLYIMDKYIHILKWRIEINENEVEE